MEPPGARKDPAIAIFLSLAFPGAGYAYVGDVAKFVRTLIAEMVVFCLAGNHWTMTLLAIGFHVFMAISAGGAARMWNERNADLPPPPPPPAARSAEQSAAVFSANLPAEPDTAAPAVAAANVSVHVPGPSLTADDFLAELRDAWGDHRAQEISDAEFSARKRSAIDRVRVGDVDDGVALLEATDALVGAGVITAAERARLKTRVGRP